MWNARCDPDSRLSPVFPGSRDQPAEASSPEQYLSICGEASLLLPADIAEQIIAHARACWPEEACGLVAGRDGAAIAIYPGRNMAPTPQVAYELDHETLARMIDFEDAGLETAAIYHSHPHGPDTPSATDIACAYYPAAIYLICSLADPARPVLRGFRIVDGQVREVRLDIHGSIE